DAGPVKTPTAATGVSTITVNGESEADGATLTATAPGESTTIDLGPGGGQLAVVALGGAAGTVDVLADDVTMSDAADATGDVGTWSFSGGVSHLAGVAPGTVNVTSPSVNTALGSGNDKLTVGGTNPTGTTQLDTGPGNDVLALSGAASVAGTALGANSGGAGTDALSYAGYGSGVTVDLGAGTATGMDGGISGFEDVTGSNFADSITGDGSANV